MKTKSLCLLGALCAANSIAAIAIYNRVFSRYERQALQRDPLVWAFRPILERLPRRIFHFKSKGKRLVGYHYPASGECGTVIFSHGMHSGADDYLPIYAHLVERGYSVVAYDGTGTYGSEGESTVGTCQAAEDLCAIVEHMLRVSRPIGPLYLMGHSLGAYAAAIAASRFPEVRGCACVSGMDLASALIMQKAREYAGIAAELNRPLISLYQQHLFGSLVHTSAVSAINGVSIPVLIAHGECDSVINEASGSLMSRRHKIVNPLVGYYLGRGSQGTHSGILFSDRANSYRDELFSFIRQNAALGRERLCRELERRLSLDESRVCCEVNSELMERVEAAFSGNFGINN